LHVAASAVARRRVRGFSLGMSQRLGLAAALLGDPRVILCDEPVNGLDPEGIHWIRTILRSLAADGRTVFVSSHLMSEMAETADHLIVIGRGRLIADASVAEVLTSAGRATTTVRTPDAVRMAALVERAGGVVTAEPDGRLVVAGLTAAQVGELAAAHRVTLHELSARQPSLEAAFLELTRDAVEYGAA
jgi:ABC-2 type transport system ATP-binding protein